MPIISPSLDGFIGANTNNWTTLLNGASGKNLSTTAQTGTGTAQGSTASSIIAASNAGGTAFTHFHSFINFDCSSISSTPTSATLTIYVDSCGVSSKYIPVRGTFDTSITPNQDYFNDFNANVPYSSLQGATAGQSNTFTLNATALSDMVGNSDFKIMLIESDYVLIQANIPNNTVKVINIGYSNSSTISFRPFLEYGTGSATNLNSITLRNNINIAGTVRFGS